MRRAGGVGRVVHDLGDLDDPGERLVDVVQPDELARRSHVVDRPVQLLDEGEDVLPVERGHDAGVQPGLHGLDQLVASVLAPRPASPSSGPASGRARGQVTEHARAPDGVVSRLLEQGVEALVTGHQPESHRTPLLVRRRECMSPAKPVRHRLVMCRWPFVHRTIGPRTVWLRSCRVDGRWRKLSSRVFGPSVEPGGPGAGVQLWWQLPVGGAAVVAVSALLEVLEPPTLGWRHSWGLQAGVVDGAGRSGGVACVRVVCDEAGVSGSEVVGAVVAGSGPATGALAVGPLRLAISTGAAPAEADLSVMADGLALADVAVWAELARPPEDPPVVARWSQLSYCLADGAQHAVPAVLVDVPDWRHLAAGRRRGRQGWHPPGVEHQTDGRESSRARVAGRPLGWPTAARTVGRPGDVAEWLRQGSAKPRHP